MPYTTVVAGTTITASWGNANVRDQVVTPFANASARDSAITSPVDGMLEYLADSDVYTRYKASTGGWRLAVPYRQVQTLSSPASTVTFSGLPSGIRNITLRISARSDTASNTASLLLRVNADSSANYFGVINQVLNATVTANNAASNTSAQIGVVAAASATAQIYSGTAVDITGWNRTDRYLQIMSRSTTYPTTANSWLWSSGWEYSVATTYTSLVLSLGAGSFTAGSEFAIEAWD